MNIKVIENIFQVKNYDYIKNYQDFDLLLNNNYSIKNKSKLLSHIRLFGSMRNTKDNKYVLSLDGIMKYVRFQSIDIGIEENNMVIQDENNSFLNNIDRLKSIKQFAKVKYIEYNNKNKEALFITFTNPSIYHFYKTSKYGLIKNKSCNDTLMNTIKNSLENINTINRSFYQAIKQELKRKNKSLKFDFVKILENHNNKSIHSHSILYFNKEDIEIVKKAYLLTIKKFGLKKCDFQILNKAKSSSYVMKYIIKSIKDINTINDYQKYKRFFSTKRFFTTSNFREITQVKIERLYNYLRNNNKGLFNRLKASNIPTYILLEKYNKKYIDTKYETNRHKAYNKEKIKKYIDENNIKSFEELEKTNILKDKQYLKDINRKKVINMVDKRNNISIYSIHDYLNTNIKLINRIKDNV